jgi:hypothetical protein
MTSQEDDENAELREADKAMRARYPMLDALDRALGVMNWWPKGGGWPEDGGMIDISWDSAEELAEAEAALAEVFEINGPRPTAEE